TTALPKYDHIQSSLAIFFFDMPRPPTSTLFPYTTLFRSIHYVHNLRRWGGEVRRVFAARPPQTVRIGGEDAVDVLAELPDGENRSEEHTSELQSRGHLVCRLLLEKKNPYVHLLMTKHEEQ